MNKIAVVMTGQIRSWDQCKENLYTKLIDKYDAAVYGFFIDDDDKDKITDEDRSRFNGITFLDSDELPFRACDHKAEETNEKKFYSQISLLSRGYYLDLSSFDVVVWCRPDTVICQDLENLFEVGHDCLYLPNHDNHRNGLNDRFAFGPPDVMRKYFNRVIYFKDYVEAGKLVHPETYLKWYLDHFSIEHKKSIVQTNTVRKDGTITCVHIN